MNRAAATASLLLLLIYPCVAQDTTHPSVARTTGETSPTDTRSKVQKSFSATPYLRFSERGPFEALLVWYPPLFIVNGVELKNFIRSRTFRKIREDAGDLRAVDAIYVRAMELTGHNTAVSLLLATVATFDHYLVGVKIPLLALYLPLSNESYDDYAARVRNLPGSLYADTPAGGRGDRDKLQHFFGSAFVSFAFESEGAANRVGDFIEFGEEVAIVDGVLDSRDKRANWHGRQFGSALLENNKRYPSEFLRSDVARTPEGAPESEEHTGCR
jgi:hypothetical protein